MSLQDKFGNIRPPHVPNAGPTVVFILGALVLVAIVTSSWYTVDQGERGVMLRNGAVIGEAEPGLGFKIPLIDTVEHTPSSRKTSAMTT